jgi:hypothetical protein
MSEPTSAVESTPATPAPAASVWEDVIDIFYQPSAVFERRRNGSAWFPFLFVVLGFALITFFTYSAIQPAMEAEVRRAMAATMAKTPGMTQETIEKAVSMQSNIARYVVGIGIAFAIFLVGLATWLVSKIFGAAETFGQAMLIASYAYFPRVLGTVLGAVIALTTDPSKMTGAAVMSVGPAHFMDPATANPFTIALAQRFDFMVLWETVLLAIGVAVIGKLPRNKAAMFAVAIWLVGGLWQLRQAYMLS